MKLEVPIGILVRRKGALGDVIITTGVVRELKTMYGDNCVIDVLTEYPQVYNNNPHVRNVIHTDTETDVSLYDVVYNLDDTYEYNPDGHFADNYFYRVFGKTNMDKSMELFVTEQQTTALTSVLDAIGGPFVVIHMRRWHWELKNIAVEIWLDIINKILEADPTIKIACTGGPTDFYPEGHPRVVDIRSLDPASTCYVMDHAKCFVGIDSAPFHIAGASETHIVALLSHMYPDRVLPFRNGVMGDNCTVIQSKVDCVGCHSRQQRPVRQIVCERGDYACNKLWDTTAIADAVIKQL
jgi:ADP-heptose:LPS heptosyltransferase